VVEREGLKAGEKNFEIDSADGEKQRGMAKRY
jgi:hypothetical protein